METNNILNIALDVANRLVGADLAEVAPVEEPTHNNEFHLSDKHETKEEEAERNKMFGRGVEHLTHLDLPEEQLNVLRDHKFINNDGSLIKDLQYYFYGGDLYINNDRWLSMCGRLWKFDLKTNEIKLTIMN